MNRVLMSATALFFALAGGQAYAVDAASTINDATLTAPKSAKYSPALVKAQILLDRAHFSPGVIDGYDGENVRKAVSAYQAAHDMPVNGQADDALLQTLIATDSAPALVAYTISEEDVRGPFVTIVHLQLHTLSSLLHPMHFRRFTEVRDGPIFECFRVFDCSFRLRRRLLRRSR